MRVEDNEGISNIIMTILTNNLDWLILYDACPIYRPMAHIPNMIGTFTSRLKGACKSLNIWIMRLFFFVGRGISLSKNKEASSVGYKNCKKLGLGAPWTGPDLT